MESDMESDAVTRRTRADLLEHCIKNAESSNFPGNYSGFNDEWNRKDFKKNFKINIVSLDKMEMEFDMIGIDVSIANAFRRILLAEVPTMAVDRVFLYNNTSLIQDEVLAHRIGLIPFKADPRLFEYRQEGDENGTPEDTLEFHLKIKCTRNRNASKDAATRDEIFKDHTVYSGDIKWVPMDNQAELYTEAAVGPVHSDILIAKLRAGQEINCKLHLVKGIGKDHAKFSPVATASYRLLSEINLKQEIEGKDAWKLKECFAEGVIDVVQLPDGREVARVADVRKDTCNRNVFMHKKFHECLKLTRVKDHFIFQIESTGALAPDVLMCEAIKILMSKCRIFLDGIEKLKVRMK